MAIYFVTRHPGALQWLQNHYCEPAIHWQHLERMDDIGHGDTVVGTLPINLIAAVCARGARYLHLEISLPQSLRGSELTARQLQELGAELVEYVAQKPGKDAAISSQAQGKGSC